MTLPPTAARIALGLDMFSMSLVLGATVWFFLVQSPVLIKSMGRERFVPLQMRLAVVFFRTVTVAIFVMTAATVLRTQSLAWPTLTAALALGAVVINQQVVLPRALGAGGRSRRVDDHHTAATTAGFVNDGAGRSTRTLHRLVVALVVLMLAGIVAHGVTFITSPVS